jgi:acetyl-CoA acyltransferase 1
VVDVSVARFSHNSLVKRYLISKSLPALARAFAPLATTATTPRQIANQIKSGEIDIGIGAGVESMTADWGSPGFPSKLSDGVMSAKEAQECLTPMGVTSENVAAKYGISRERQDKFAVESFRKAARARKEGKFQGEIVPVRVSLALVGLAR